VRAGLDHLGVAYDVAPRLVRGLDYYTRTTFEFASASIGAAQNAIGGGGRYDGLVEQFGAPPTGGIGFGSGIERILLACDAEGVFAATAATVDVFVIDVAGGAHALSLADALRRSGLRADRAFDGRSMKAQMKRADASGARLALIVGAKEAADGTVTVRDLVDGDQQTIPWDDAVVHVHKRLGST
jgi:histidyl-tRNA synthetase